MNFVLNFLLALLFGLIQSFTAPLSQDPKYHSFAGDGLFVFFHQSCCSTRPRYFSNPANVFSNLPFALVGLLGLLIRPQLDLAWTGFCVGSILVCFGSAYYHWLPNNATLVWDRLPMTLCTTSIAFIVLRKWEILSLDSGDLGLWWFVGILSVVYWARFDDLRLYAYIQYFPILCILIGAIVIPTLNSLVIIPAILLYSVARVCEYYDASFYQQIGVSGHVLKHILCAISMYWCLLLE